MIDKALHLTGIHLEVPCLILWIHGTGNVWIALSKVAIAALLFVAMICAVKLSFTVEWTGWMRGGSCP